MEEENEEQLILLAQDKNLDLEGKRNVMKKLLNSDCTLYSPQMKNWLMQPGICEMLLQFITRPTTPPNISASLGLDSAEYLYSSERRRDALLERVPQEGEDANNTEFGDEDMGLQFTKAAKRADKAAEVFVYHVSQFPGGYIEASLPSLIKALFDIFDVHAEGDFDNFDKVFQSLFNPHGGKIIALLSQNEQVPVPQESKTPSESTPASTPTKTESKAKLVLHLLNYLHDPAISDTLFCIMKTILPDEAITNFYTALTSSGFFSYLGSKIYGPLGRSSFEESAEFFGRLIDLCSSYNHADVLFAELGRNGTALSGLVEGIINKSGDIPREQQVACIHSTKALLLKSGEQLFDQSLDGYTQTPLPNMLKPIRDQLHSFLRSKVPEISNKLLEDADLLGKGKDTRTVEFPTYTIRHTLTLHRMALLDILVELASESPIEVLDRMPAPLWRVLSNWCFDHKYNNVYHDVFYKLFLTSVKQNHIASQKALLSKYKFLSRIIDHYLTTNTQTTGFRGWIIKIGNYLRLTAETQQPGDYLRNFLSSHEAWKEFVNVLKDDTVAQIITDFPAPPSMGPINPFAPPPVMFNVPRKPLVPITRADVNIELGSKYANDLGLEGKKPAVVAEKKGRNRKRKKGPKKQQPAAAATPVVTSTATTSATPATAATPVVTTTTTTTNTPATVVTTTTLAAAATNVSAATNGKDSSSKPQVEEKRTEDSGSKTPSANNTASATTNSSTPSVVTTTTTAAPAKNEQPSTATENQTVATENHKS